MIKKHGTTYTDFLIIRFRKEYIFPSASRIYISNYMHISFANIKGYPYEPYIVNHNTKPKYTS